MSDILAQQLMMQARQPRRSTQSRLAEQMMSQIGRSQGPVWGTGATLAAAVPGLVAGFLANRGAAEDRENEAASFQRLQDFDTQRRQQDAAGMAGIFGGGMGGGQPAPQMPQAQPPSMPMPQAPMQAAPLPQAPQRGEAPAAVAGGIQARAALDPNAPDYPERIMAINNGVIGQTMPGQAPQPVAQQPGAPQLMPQAAPTGAMPQQAGITPQQIMQAQMLAAQGNRQAAAVLPGLQWQYEQQQRAQTQVAPTVEMDGPQGPGIYERTPQGPRFLGPRPPPVEGAPLSPQRFQQNMDLAAAGRPTTEIRTGQTFGEALGRNTAEQLGTLQTQAQTAVGTIQAAERINGLLQQGAITGSFAEGRLGLERALASVGLIDGRRVTNTEQLMADLANNVLASAQQMTGVLTDRDIQFLREASAGSITLTPDTIRQVTELSSRGARRQIDRYNSVAGSLGGAQDLPEVTRQIYQPIQIPGLQPPGAQQQGAPVSLPPSPYAMPAGPIGAASRNGAAPPPPPGFEVIR